MSDITAQLLPALQNHRLNGLPHHGDWILPQYQGHSIVNLPPSIADMLGAPGFRGGSLAPELLGDLGGGAKRVLLILVDALGLLRFQNWLEAGHAPIWQQLIDQGRLAAITSTVPSTTSTALPSLWSGFSPAEHGMIGYELFLKEYGIVSNMITHAPITYHSGGSGLEKAGFQPELLLPGSTLGTHLAEHGIQAHAFLHYAITHSGLSRSFLHDVNVHPFGGLSDLWISAQQLFERQNGPMFTWVYWSQVDSLSHRYGPDDPRTAADFSLFSLAFERYFLNSLSPAARKDTLVLMIADHGQVFTPKTPTNELRNHSALSQTLHIQPTGENRLPYLFVRPGQLDKAEKMIHQIWPDGFLVLPAEQAIQSGLFGSGQPHPRLRERMGDMVIIPRQQGYIWWADKENPLLGRHGGLSPDEMLVPLLAARL